MLQDSASFAQPPTPTSVVPAAPPIELSETQPRKVAFIEHSGPYWSLGSVINKVARDARTMGVQDELLIRYLDDSTGTSSGALHADIGFGLTDAKQPPASYKVAEWPIELAVRKTVTGPDGLSMRHFFSLKSWARSQDLAPAGDMIAVVQFAVDGENTTIEEAEILLPVCVPDPPVASPTVLLRKGTESDSSTEILADAKPSRKITRVIQLPSQDAEFGSDEGSSQDVRQAVVIPIGKQVPVDAGDAPQRPIAKEQRARDVEEQPAAPQFASPAVRPKPSAPRRTKAPVREWIENGKFAEIATALLPTNSNTATFQWADQITARILAIANAVRKTSPDDEGWLGELSTQLAARREAATSATSKAAPKVIGPSTANDPLEGERKAMMLEFDRFMAEVSYRSLNPSQIRDKLTDLLEMAIPLVLP